MSLIRLVQLALAIAAVLATTLLGSAQGSAALPLLAMVTAPLAFYLTDVRGNVRFSGWLANAAALGAAAFCLTNFFANDRNEQLVSIANLLIYLQTILLFQEKTVRVGWQLLSLGLLQVVVAAALSNSILFGLLVLLYTAAGLLAVVLLCCHRESQLQGAAFEVGRARGPRSTLRSKFNAKPAAPSLAPAPVLPMSFYRSMAGTAALLVVGSLAIGTAVFLTVPRMGRPRLFGADSAGSSTSTGYTDDVKLNQAGRNIFDDSSIVMRLMLNDERTGKAIIVPGELLLRGGVSVKYSDGRWSPSNQTHDAQIQRADDVDIVRQTIYLEPAKHDRMFCVYPAVDLSSDPRLIFSPLRRSDREAKRGDAYTPYVIGTTGVVDDEGRLRQQDVIPAGPVGKEERDAMRRFPPSNDHRFDGLTAFARQHVGAARNNYERAKNLEQALKLSPDFRYTRALPERDPDRDPIEDFITSHQQGNCEFFASALVLALRSQGIPARLARGYKSGEWNLVGGYLMVRQLHAHAWVEAYLPANQIPATGLDGHKLILRNHDYSSGAWLQLDPTPDDNSLNQLAMGKGWFTEISNYYDHLDMMWRNYVIGFDRNQQDAHVFSFFTSLAFAADDPGQVTSADRRSSSRIWQWALAAIAGVSIAATAWVKGSAGLRAALVRLRSWYTKGTWRRRSKSLPAARRVEFYARFERDMARFGFRRQCTQTPLEFAHAVGGQLFDAPHLRDYSRVPRQFAEAFYRVRHGGQSLVPGEAERLEQSRAELHAALASRRATSAPSTAG
jgi:transglutaminase-like putative cysteine protease